MGVLRQFSCFTYRIHQDDNNQDPDKSVQSKDAVVKYRNGEFGERYGDT